MNESIAVAKEADAKKSFSSARRNDKSIQLVRDESERQLDSLGGVIGNIRRDGAVPSAESIATELGGRSAAERAPALLALQQTHGNRYVQRVVAGIQAKLVVGQPGDIYEQEADRVAEQVMRMPEPGVQRQVEPEEEEEEETLQPKSLAEQITPLVQRQVEPEEEEEEEIQTKQLPSQSQEIIPDVETRINNIRGGGQPLPESARAFFEPRFKHDFSRVRVHTDAKATDTALAVNARAFTRGHDVVFGAGQYAPGTHEGRRLVAHELTHTVQQQPQQSSSRSTVQPRDAISRGNDPLEYEADTVASQAMVGRPISHAISSRAIGAQSGIARQTAEEAPLPEDVSPGVTLAPRLYRIKIGEREIVLTESEFRTREEDLTRGMKKLARDGKSWAEFYRRQHKHHMEEVRGWAGTISDFVSGVIPPSVTMWGPTINVFKKAEENLNKRNLREAYYDLKLAYPWLNDDIKRWKTYMRRTIEGAENVVTGLKMVRDAALALEVALITGGTAYGVLGGGKLAAGAATVLGATVGAKTAAMMPGEFGEAARGTAAELKAAGLYNNMRYAVNGLYGMAMGVGKGFSAMFEGLATLFTDPLKFAEDLGKLPNYIIILWEYREQLWRHFESLPPEEQAYRVGEFFGVIESFLITIEAGNQIGTALEAESGGMTFAGGIIPGEVAAMRVSLVSLRAEAITTFGTSMMITAETSGLGGEAQKAAKKTSKKPPSKKAPKKKFTKKEILEEFAEAQRKEPKPSLEKDILDQRGIREAAKPGGKPIPEKFEVGNFAHKYAEDLIPKSKLPQGLDKEVTIKLPEGQIRLDRVDFKNRVIYEIKPNTASQIKMGKNQVKNYIQHMNVEYPGVKWRGEVVTYNRNELIKVLKKIGYLK